MTRSRHKPHQLSDTRPDSTDAWIEWGRNNQSQLSQDDLKMLGTMIWDHFLLTMARPTYQAKIQQRIKRHEEIILGRAARHQS